MAVVAWANLTIATLTDLEREIGKGSILFSAYDTPLILDARETIKQQIFIDLKSDLTDIFASRNGKYQRFDVIIREMGYSYNELETMLDKIGNPEMLVEAAKAKWAKQLWEWLGSDDRPNWKAMAGIALDKSNEKEKEYQRRLKLAKKNLWLDLNDDGQTVDYERVRTHTSFVRT